MNSVMETVCGVCVAVKSITKPGISFRKLLAQIRREFKQQDIDIKVRTERDKTLNEEMFYANGYYDPYEDQSNECHIELVITHNFPKDFVWYPKQSRDLLMQVFDTVVHELRHQRQYRKRRFKSIPEESNSHAEYLADPDEIDAYAISIAVELSRSLGRVRALRYLQNISKLGRFKLNGQFVSPSLSMYLETFPNITTPVIRSLSKKVYVRLKKVDTDYIFM